MDLYTKAINYMHAWGAMQLVQEGGLKNQDPSDPLHPPLHTRLLHINIAGLYGRLVATYWELAGFAPRAYNSGTCNS